MEKRIVTHVLVFCIGFVIGISVMPGKCQRVGQKLFVGTKSQKEFETLSAERKMATLNWKLDYLIQKSLPPGCYIDDDGIVQSSIRTTVPKIGPFSGQSGTVHIDPDGTVHQKIQP